MTGDLPTSTLGRALSGGRTAARAGAQMLGYYAKRPFLSVEQRDAAREKVAQNSARTLFQGLSLLRGTALKMAQQLSLEMDLFPESVCRELARACHQVPPINRALVRKAVFNALGQPPERCFRHFDLQAFAAASLGQVHRAVSLENTLLAVKVQYPGISTTIDSDVRLLYQLLRPVMGDDQLIPALDELSARLHEEIDYCREAAYLTSFAERLHIEGIRVPVLQPELSAETLLTTSLMPGVPLDVWLQTHPDQAACDGVAERLNALFLTGLYEHHMIHADPNPGNFIIADDLTIGLVDFGCVKRLSPEFVEQYRKLVWASAHRNNDAHFRQMAALGIMSADLDADTEQCLHQVSNEICQWFSRLYADETFDFSGRCTFIREGKTVLRRFHGLRRHLTVNPEFIFLDRTRYGLLRLFEMLGARVRFRNPFEWGE